jgi:hypothetical protein
MPLKLNGSTSGYAQIQAAATAANNTLTLPSSGTNLLSDATLPTTTPTNGQIPVGNGTTYVPATITAGTGITVTNGAGSISIASSAAGGFSNMVAFTSGTSTWTIPAGITVCKITVIGGGNNGGVYFNGGCNPNSSGGGGGGGGAAIKYFTGLTPSNTLSYTVGAAGGTSSVSSGTQTIVTISATGGSVGSAGVLGAGGAGGAGGLGSGGTLNIKGGSGTNGISSGAPLSGTGGSSIYGGGGTGSAVAGGAYGGGGSGATTTGAAGAGAAGVVIIEY